jgi:hypothetical protein
MEKRSRISKIEGALVIGFVGMVDFAQLIFTLLGIGVILNTGLTILLYPFLWLWLRLRGISLLSPRYLITFGGGFFIGILPLVSSLPELTLSVGVTVLMAWFDDATYNKERREGRERASPNKGKFPQGTGRAPIS